MADPTIETDNTHFLSHLAMQVFNTPLMILPQKLEVITRVLGGRIGMEGGVASADMVKARPVATVNTPEVAVIPIIGSLVHRAMGMDAMSGVRSYQNIREDLRFAVNDPKTSGILLDIDSPGGMVAGVFDLADEIRAANEQKPVYAYVNEGGYSAGYLLAASAGKLFLPRTGGVGSIGVRMLHVDQSELNKKAGIKVTNLFVGDRKVDFDPHSPLSKEAHDAAMKDLKEMYGLFVEAVAKYRGMSVEAVKSTEAAMFMGSHAVEAGLADEVMTLDEAMSFIGNDLATVAVVKAKNPKTARGRASSEKEVKHKMPNTIAEFKTESPDLYQEMRALVEQDLRASFDTEKKGLEAQVAGLKGELQEKEKKAQEQDARILKLEKADYIRSEKEKAARIANASDRVWTQALAVSDVPERIHAKVKAMVKTDAFVHEDTLDEEAYKAAVHAEIAEWEGKGMTTTVLGAGFSGNKPSGEVDPHAKDAKAQEEEDEAWVQKMLKLGGQVENGGEV